MSLVRFNRGSKLTGSPGSFRNGQRIQWCRAGRRVASGHQESFKHYPSLSFLLFLRYLRLASAAPLPANRVQKCDALANVRVSLACREGDCKPLAATPPRL
jgi:hypothetical protein